MRIDVVVRIVGKDQRMKILGISAGRDRSAALMADGSAMCWGGIKKLGATLPPGYPADLCISNPTEVGHNRFAQPVPQHLNPGHPFVALADGYVDTLGVERTGAVVSCHPVVSQQHGAVRMAIAGMPSTAIAVAPTESGAFALHTDGVVWSWGLNVNGQLGRIAPPGLQGPGAIGGMKPIAALASGSGHGLALDRRGRVWAWGANGAGQTGTGTLQARMTPTQVDLPVRVKQIAAGDTHSFALDEAGGLWGWGSNNFGQVGDPSAKFFTRPVRIRIEFPVAQIDAGMYYTVATSTHGEVFAWGWNAMGQLAREDLAYSAKPMRVAPMSDVARIAAGVGHVLAANDVGVFAWGNNRSSACGLAPNVSAQIKPRLVALAQERL